jgi:hypothetical protein
MVPSDTNNIYFLKGPDEIIDNFKSWHFKISLKHKSISF